jgi:membrane protease YdiL (CAAX protease family)
VNLSVLTATRPRRMAWSHLRLLKGVAGYLAALVVADVLALQVSQLLAAACLAVTFVVLVNLTILAHGRESAWPVDAWCLLAVAAIPPLERLLMICMPPLRWGPVQEYVLWSVPLFVGAMVVLRTPLLATVRDLRPHVIGTTHGGGYGLSGWSGQALLVVVGALLGAVAGILAEGRVRPIGQLLEAAQPAWFGIVVLAFAGGVQELVYRAVVDPVATALGARVGILLSSLLMASAWFMWLGAGIAVAVPIIAASLLFGWAVHRSRALIGALAGHGLFNVALALLWHRMLL